MLQVARDMRKHKFAHMTSFFRDALCSQISDASADIQNRAVFLGTFYFVCFRGVLREVRG